MNSYNKYLENEKIYSEKFLKYHQILDERFNECDYNLVKAIWHDTNLINGIYTVIDDLLLSYKLNKNLRFLFIGDFLFSLFSFDLNDPSELVLKTSRNSYIYRIKLRGSINILFDCEWEKYIELHKKLLIGLRDKKILKRTQIRSLKEDVWHTTIYFILETSILLDPKHIINVSKYAFVVINIHSVKYSLGSFRNLWKIKRKKREMEDIEISYDSVIKANQIDFILSSKLYKINQIIIEKENVRLLTEISCTNFEDYFSKIKNIFKDKSYTSQLALGREQIDDITRYDIILLKRVIKEECINLMSRFQRILSMFYSRKILFDQKFYLPCFMDNRGRQYYGTLLSPTFYILFRNLYEFNTTKDFTNLYTSEFYKRIMKYQHLVNEFDLIKNEKFYVAIILFIEVGKFFMKNKNEYHISTEKIIELGIKNYRSKNIDLKFDDMLYLNKIYYLLDNLILTRNIEKNTMIFKDATASGLQNYGILLGYKEEKLKYLNLDGFDWYDTYQYIIQTNLEGNDIFLKRKYWKKTLMTIPYNASWYSCFKDFIECLRKDGIEYTELSNKDEIKEMHKNFYNKIKKEIKKEFFIREKGELKLFKYNKWKIVSIKDYKINYNKLRDKYRSTLYMVNEDSESTQKALEANNMHYLDAELVKHLLEKFDILTIHDCFGIRLCELHLLIDAINLYYSKIIGKSTYSIHIII